MAESTLVLRLAGPLQAWGEESKFNVRGTLPYPSYSGLLGLCRAALGHGRHSDDGFSELRQLAFVVRSDARGSLLRDYHSVNPPRAGLGEYTVPNGSGKPWSIGGGPSTLLTERYYLTNAAFTVLITGAEDRVERLAKALRGPTWHISLGRKACVPDFPLVLGTTSEPIEHLLASIPIIDVDTRLTDGENALRPVEVHWLTGKPTPDAPDVVHWDDPQGGHPHDGYRMHTRWINRTDYTAQVVTSRHDLLAWASDNLVTGYGAK